MGIADTGTRPELLSCPHAPRGRGLLSVGCTRARPRKRLARLSNRHLALSDGGVRRCQGRNSRGRTPQDGAREIIETGFSSPNKVSKSPRCIRRVQSVFRQNLVRCSCLHCHPSQGCRLNETYFSMFYRWACMVASVVLMPPLLRRDLYSIYRYSIFTLTHPWEGCRVIDESGAWHFLVHDAASRLTFR